MNRLARRLFAILLLAAVPAVAAPESDLAADFSTVANPFGPWTLWRAPGSPFPTCQPDFYQNGTNLRAWADQPFPLPMHVPLWAAGPAGADWEGASNYRVMRWQLWHGEALLTGGDITTDGTWTQEHPFDFAAGTGGPGAVGLTLVR